MSEIRDEIAALFREHTDMTDRSADDGCACGSVDWHPDHLADALLASPALAAYVAGKQAEALRAEADLIGNGTCCDECNEVANMMRDRAALIEREGAS